MRRYGRLHVTRAAVAFEHGVMARAAAHVREVVAPLRDAAGESIVTAPDGGFAAAFPYVDGETGRRDLDTARAAARVLARFHRAMRGAHVDGAPNAVRFADAFARLRERFTAFADDPPVAHALDWNALIAATAAAATRVAPHAAALPVTVVHGDPNPGNVVTAERDDGATTAERHEVRALIDFDFAHATERVYDLGAFLDEFARAGDDAALDVARVAPLLAAYAEETPLPAAERAVIPEAMLRRAATLAWYVAARHGERVPGDVGGAPRYAARAAEIAANADAIREAARG